MCARTALRPLQDRTSGRHWLAARSRAFRATGRCGFAAMACLVLVTVLNMTAARADTLSGTASIRERIALPPGVVFEAVIEDISRAGAPASRLASTVIETPGQPPFAFSIDYDATRLDPRAVYALRATVRLKGRLLFTTDTLTRVLQDGGSQPVQVVLKMVPQP